MYYFLEFSDISSSNNNVRKTLLPLEQHNKNIQYYKESFPSKQRLFKKIQLLQDYSSLNTPRQSFVTD